MSILIEQLEQKLKEREINLVGMAQEEPSSMG